MLTANDLLDDLVESFHLSMMYKLNYILKAQLCVCVCVLCVCECVCVCPELIGKTIGSRDLKIFIQG